METFGQSYATVAYKTVPWDRIGWNEVEISSRVVWTSSSTGKKKIGMSNVTEYLSIRWKERSPGGMLNIQQIIIDDAFASLDCQLRYLR